MAIFSVIVPISCKLYVMFITNSYINKQEKIKFKTLSFKQPSQTGLIYMCQYILDWNFFCNSEIQTLDYLAYLLITLYVIETMWFKKYLYLSFLILVFKYKYLGWGKCLP